VLGAIVRGAYRDTEYVRRDLQLARTRVDDLEDSIRKRDKTIADLRETEKQRSEYYKLLTDSINARQRVLDEIGKITGERQDSFNRVGELIKRGREINYRTSTEDAE
jgi:hypothetical protein